MCPPHPPSPRLHSLYCPKHTVLKMFSPHSKWKVVPDASKSGPFTNAERRPSLRVGLPKPSNRFLENNPFDYAPERLTPPRRMCLGPSRFPSPRSKFLPGFAIVSVLDERVDRHHFLPSFVAHPPRTSGRIRSGGRATRRCAVGPHASRPLRPQLIPRIALRKDAPGSALRAKTAASGVISRRFRSQV